MAPKLAADLAKYFGDLDGQHKQFGDVNVASEILDVSPSYLNKLRMTGSGPHYVKFGAAVRYIIPQLLPWAMARALQHVHVRGLHYA